MKQYTSLLHSDQRIFIEESFTPVLTQKGQIIAEKRTFTARSRSKKSTLLCSLASSRTGILQKKDLISALYPQDKDAPETFAIKSVKYACALKTVSRLRIELEKFFGDLTPPNFDWLPWSEKLGGWILFRRSYTELCF